MKKKDTKVKPMLQFTFRRVFLSGDAKSDVAIYIYNIGGGGGGNICTLILNFKLCLRYCNFTQIK